MALLDGAFQASLGPTLFGASVKEMSLITLTLQNSVLTLILHYSRVMPTTDDHRYFPSTAVFLNEVLKLAISLTFAIYEASRTLAPQTPVSVIFQQIYNAVFSKDSWKLAIPATLYTLQNTLQYVALGNLNPVQFQVLYQLKILTTAFFSVTMLHRTLTPKRWIALILLTIGVSAVSLTASDSKDSTLIIHDFSDHFFPRSMHELGQQEGGVAEVARELTKRTAYNALDRLTRRSASYQGIDEDQDTNLAMVHSVGITAVLVAVTISGLTGVYFEKVLKDAASPASIWIRNIQLSAFSLVPALFVGIAYKDGEEILKHGFFYGYNWVVWDAIVFQAVGGIVASLCIHYADNIAKNFATSFSLVISFLFSTLFFGFQATPIFGLGTCLVLVATYIYTQPSRKRGRPPPITIANLEKTTVVTTPKHTDNPRPSPKYLESARTLAVSTSRPSSPLCHHTKTASNRQYRDE